MTVWWVEMGENLWQMVRGGLSEDVILELQYKF